MNRAHCIFVRKWDFCHRCLNKGCFGLAANSDKLAPSEVIMKFAYVVLTDHSKHFIDLDNLRSYLVIAMLLSTSVWIDYFRSDQQSAELSYFIIAQNAKANQRGTSKYSRKRLISNFINYQDKYPQSRHDGILSCGSNIFMQWNLNLQQRNKIKEIKWILHF